MGKFIIKQLPNPPKSRDGAGHRAGAPSLWDGHHATGPGSAAHAGTVTAARATMCWGHPGVPMAISTGSGCGQGLATPAPGWTSRLHHRCGGMLALLVTSIFTAQPRRGCSRCPGVSPSPPHVLKGRGLGPGLRGRELGSAACSGMRSRRASAAARSCAHLDFSRLRSTSLLNQMAKINKYNKSEPPDTNWELTPGLCVS